MSSRIARLLIGMAVAVAIVPLGIGAVGSAGAHPSGLRLAAQDCLTNRSESPVSETDARYAGRRDRREAARPGCWGSRLVAQVLSRGRCPPRPNPARLAALDHGSV